VNLKTTTGTKPPGGIINAPGKGKKSSQEKRRKEVGVEGCGPLGRRPLRLSLNPYSLVMGYKWCSKKGSSGKKVGPQIHRVAEGGARKSKLQLKAGDNSRECLNNLFGWKFGVEPGGIITKADLLAKGSCSAPLFNLAGRSRRSPIK